MVTAAVFLADGFEEIEGLTCVDILRRAQVKVDTVSLHPNKNSVGSRSVPVICDKYIEDVAGVSYDVLVLPGGMPGAKHLSESNTLVKMLKEQIASSRWTAAICAAPSVVLGARKLFPENAKGICYPSMEEDMGDHFNSDGNLTTCVDKDHKIRPATAMEFALTIVKNVKSIDAAETEAKKLLYTHNF